MKWNIGCSGFFYKHWKGTFYPTELPQKKWFDFYCEHFNTLELNSSFYRYPSLSALRNWHTKAPSDSRFAVKANKSITHYRQFNNVAQPLHDFYQLLREGLQEKLGCVLFQMPPRFSYTEERMEKILKNIDSSFLNVVEFRHESWWTDEVYKEFSQKNISFCGMSHPTLPKDLIVNTPMLYYRFHGEQALYASNYEDQQLEQLAAKIRGKDIVKEAYIFFNNDIHTYAAYNALSFKRTEDLNRSKT